MAEIKTVMQQDPDSREAKMVVLRRDERNTPTVWCDPEIVDLVDALNNGKLTTIASCSGHGELPFGAIALADGRELLILPDWDSARRAEAAVLSANAGKVDATSAQAVVKELLDDECDAIECNYKGKRYRLDLVALESPTQQAIDTGKVGTTYYVRHPDESYFVANSQPKED